MCYIINLCIIYSVRSEKTEFGIKNKSSQDNVTEDQSRIYHSLRLYSHYAQTHIIIIKQTDCYS